MANNRIFGGKAYYRHQWMSSKSRAKQYADSLRAKGLKVRVVAGQNADGDNGWLIYCRR